MQTSPFTSVRYAPRRRWRRGARLLRALVVLALLLALVSVATLWFTAVRSFGGVEVAGLDAGAPTTLVVTRAGDATTAALVGTSPDRGPLVLALDAVPAGTPDERVAAVAQATGVPIGRYVEVDLARAAAVADVPCGDAAWLTGAEAPAERLARQAAFATVLAGQLTRPAAYANPLRGREVVRDAGAAVTPSSGVSTVEAGQALRQLAALDASTVSIVALPDAAEPAGALLEALRTGGPMPDPATLQGPPPVQPADVPLTILNGVGESGLAARAQQELSRVGFRIPETGNAERFGFERTEVRYPPAAAAHAELVARFLGGAPIVEDAEAPRVTVVLGKDRAQMPAFVDPAASAPAPEPPPAVLGVAACP